MKDAASNETKPPLVEQMAALLAAGRSLADIAEALAWIAYDRGKKQLGAGDYKSAHDSHAANRLFQFAAQELNARGL